MTTAPDPRQANGGAERGDHVELLLIRHEETAGQDAQPQVSGRVRDPIPAAPALLDPAIPCDRPGAAPGNFTDCYTRELPGLIWFVMSLGANAEVAADVAQSAFTDAFPLWLRIRHPRAWLRRVAERGYYRRGFRETLVESPPERPEPLPTASDVELQDEARAVLAALAALPPKQRQVMAWCIDGYSPAEIASEIGADPAAVRQNLAKARKNLKQMLGITGSTR
jgi:RNA polymerase sigma factor (sigma-70 family)